MTSYLHRQVSALVTRDTLPAFGKKKLERALDLLGDGTVNMQNLAETMQQEIHMCLVAAQGSALGNRDRALADEIEALRNQTCAQIIQKEEEAIRGDPQSELTDAHALLDLHPELGNDARYMKLIHDLEAQVAGRN